MSRWRSNGAEGGVCVNTGQGSNMANILANILLGLVSGVNLLEKVS